ncbi:cupredoxin domain-containing protein, partial [Rhizobiaceae sp. 2RAB30]
GEVKRTVKITMAEKDDGSMVFEPAVLQVKAGETIRLKFTNTGETDHEFVMDTNTALMEHKVQMEKFPEMEHADANSLRLAPGKSGEIVWTFANTGDFTFAC